MAAARFRDKSAQAAFRKAMRSGASNREAMSAGRATLANKLKARAEMKSSGTKSNDLKGGDDYKRDDAGRFSS